MDTKPTYEELLQHNLELARSEARRRSAEQALRENQRKLSTLMGNLPGMAFRCLNDHAWTMEFVSDGCAALTGCAPDDLLGNAKFSYDELIHPEDRQMVEDIINDALGDRRKYQLTYRIIVPDGQWKWVWEQGQGIWDGGDEATAIEGFITDITERRQAELELARSKTFLDGILNGIGDPVFVKDEHHRVIAVNDAYCRYFKCTREWIVGKSDFDLFPTHEAELFWAHDDMVIGENRIDVNEESVTVEGRRRIISTVKSPLIDPATGRRGLVGTIRDLTAQKANEEELQKMRNLQSVGLLAGGIAHDFNNNMTSLLGNVALAAAELPADHPAFTSLAEAQKSMSRATGLTQQLLTFSKGGAPVKEGVSLGGLVEEVARFDLSGSQVKLEFEQAPDLWDAVVDQAQMQQVFSNLVINANHAMPDGGHLKITLENARLDDDEEPVLPAGDYVKVVVADDGKGIEPEHLARVFEPYFSTKRQGSGLGLATTFSIINKHDGRISVASQIGEGTTFTILLPAVADERPGRTESPVSEWSSGEIAPRVLLMDDDLSICTLVRRMLGRHGMTVEVASDGREAIAVYEQALKSGEKFDVVIMDLTVPGGVGGKEAVGEILNLDPEARVVVSSGYSEDPVMAAPAEYGFKGIAIKPYTTEKLMGVLRRVMAD